MDWIRLESLVCLKLEDRLKELERKIGVFEEKLMVMGTLEGRTKAQGTGVGRNFDERKAERRRERAGEMKGQCAIVAAVDLMTGWKAVMEVKGLGERRG